MEIKNSFIKVLLILVGLSSYSQTVNFEGKITTTSSKPLKGANVLAFPSDKNQDLVYAITDEKGFFKLKLNINSFYNISISFLGYNKIQNKIYIKDRNLIKNFVLSENFEKLDDIVIDYKPPIIAKKDTITYDIKSFIKGNERKLRDVLSKLPGIEVDKKGNIMANGKIVSKILVENKTFFTGNPKLAVNNIPAYVIEKISLLDNYNARKLLKQFNQSEELALNVSLKEDKKKFVFGDVEAGVGINKRHELSTNLFYYSPNSNFNVIGDLNNTGKSSFSLRDYIDFEGGINSFFRNSNNSNTFNEELSQFLNNNDFISRSSKFGAVNYRISKNKSEFNSYLIASKAETNTLENSFNIYQNVNIPLEEVRKTSKVLEDSFILTKLNYDYHPNINEQLNVSSYFKINSNSGENRISTFNPNLDNFINTVKNVNTYKVKTNFSYGNKMSDNHTVFIESAYELSKGKSLNEWYTDQNIFQSLIPLINEETFNIFQDKHLKNGSFNFVFKDFWNLKKFKQLYSSIGFNINSSSLFNKDLQILNNGDVNNFESSGFGNDFNSDFFDLYLGFEYKFQLGKLTLLPTFFYHNYFWRNKQNDLEIVRNKKIILPQVKARVVFNKSEKIVFNYEKNVMFPRVDQMIDNFILTSFSSVSKGNIKLENDLSHNFSMSYTKFNLFKGISISLNANYSLREQIIRDIVNQEGIESVSETFNLDRPEKNWLLSARLKKKINKLRYSFNGRLSENEYNLILNSENFTTISKNYVMSLGVETLFNEHPNLNLNYSKNYNTYLLHNQTNQFENEILKVEFDIDFYKDFTYNFNLMHNKYENLNQNISNTFNISNTSLVYTKSSSPWVGEINVTNLFDVKFKRRNSVNSILISDTNTFINPRIIMFKLGYNL